MTTILVLLLSVAGASGMKDWKARYGAVGLEYHGVIAEDFTSESGYSVFNRRCGKIPVPAVMVADQKLKKGSPLAYKMRAGQRCSIEATPTNNLGGS